MVGRQLSTGLWKWISKLQEKILPFPKENDAEIYFVMYIWTPKEVIDFAGHFSFSWYYCKCIDSKKVNSDTRNFTKDGKPAILPSQWTNAVKMFPYNLIFILQFHPLSQLFHSFLLSSVCFIFWRTSFNMLCSYMNFIMTH